MPSSSRAFSKPLKAESLNDSSPSPASDSKIPILYPSVDVSVGAEEQPAINRVIKRKLVNNFFKFCVPPVVYKIYIGKNLIFLV